MRKLILIVILAHFAMGAHAQGAIASGLFSARRVVKTNLTGYALLSVSLNYEQKLGPKTTAGLLAGYKLPSVIKVRAIGDLEGERQTYTGDV